MNSKTIIISFSFINKRGELKTVHFPFDEKYYADLHHPSISEEQRNAILLDAYRLYCSDQYYNKRHVGFLYDDEGRIIDKADNNSNVENDSINKIYIERIIKSLDYLSEKQKEAVMLVYFKGYTVTDAANKMGIKKNTMSELLKRAISKLQELLNSK